MYEELVKALHDGAEFLESSTPGIKNSFAKMCHNAADAIEELLNFAHFVASNVVVSDEEWDNNMLVFPEVASRKLNKLGIVEKDGACWSYEPPKEKPTCEDCQRECQMMGLAMEACASYEPPKEET